MVLLDPLDEVKAENLNEGSEHQSHQPKASSLGSLNIEAKLGRRAEAEGNRLGCYQASKASKRKGGSSSVGLKLAAKEGCGDQAGKPSPILWKDAETLSCAQVASSKAHSLVKHNEIHLDLAYCKELSIEAAEGLGVLLTA